MLTIQSISQTPFDNRVADRSTKLGLEERAWFCLQNALGVLMFNHTKQDWTFVVSRPDEVGVMHVIDLGQSGFHSAEKATVSLR